MRTPSPTNRRIQCKRINGSSADLFELQADRVADEVLSGRSVEPTLLQHASTAGVDLQSSVASDRLADVEAAFFGGELLSHEVRARFEPALGVDLGRVRVHKGSQAALAAEAMRAHAFTSGPHVVFGSGQYAPGTQAGFRLLAHELAHVVQQGTTPVRRVQPHNTTDPRLPANLTEALSFAAAANTEIQAALTRLATNPDRRRRNVPGFVTQQTLTLRPLTPRHDSTVGAASIKFFPGFTNYSGWVTLLAATEYIISPDLRRISIRARDHADVDNLLPTADIDNLVVRTVSEVAELMATSQTVPGLTTFDRYRARFNSMYEDPAFSGLSDNWQRTPVWGSHGPPSARSHAVFQAIYDSSPTFRAEYDADRFMKELVDSYMGPNELNPLASPGLQRLRAAFFPSPMPVITAAEHTTLLTAVQAASATLAAEDRTAVGESNAWERLINDYELVVGDPVLTDTRRREIRDAIANPPVTPSTTPVVTGPTTTTPVTGAGCSPQTFVDSVSLAAPTPITAVDSEVLVAFVPHATCANPGVTTSSRIALTPPGSIIGNGVDTQPWPNGSPDGVPFMPDIRVSTGLTIDAQLDLVGGPARSVPAVPSAHVVVDDQRESNLAAQWQPEISFNNGQFQQVFGAGAHPRYIAGGQTFEVVGQIAVAPNHNPQLAVSLEAEVSRGGVILRTQTLAWQLGADRTAAISLSVTPPSPFPTSGLDSLTISTRLRNAAGALIAGSARSRTIGVGPESTYTQVDAEAAWTRDFNFFHHDSPNLIGLMASSGDPRKVGFAELVTNSLLTLHPMIIRNDSAAYVTQLNHGNPDPTRHAWLVNTPPYLPMPLPATLDPTHTHVAPTSWAAMSKMGFSAVPGRFVVVNRTDDVSTGHPRDPAEIMMLAVHEAVHEFDFPFFNLSPIEKYRTEFRAYWTDGRFGPPDQATVPGHPEQSANPNPNDPLLHPPGPQSRRANRLFHLLYDDVVGYRYVRTNYDQNINHFREQVDTYLIPDGINLILSRRLALLWQIVDAGPGGSFPTYRDNILAFFGLGPHPAPAPDVLTTNERAYIRSSRQWRDRIFVLVTDAPNRTAILNDMGIPP